MPKLFLVTVFARDIQASCNFYQKLFNFPLVPELSTPIFRAVNCGNLTLGFHADEAYDVLDLRDRQRGDSRAVDLLITFDADSKEDVDAKVTAVTALGGSVVKPPFITYYNHYQAVLADIDNTVFRVSYPLPVSVND